MKRRMKKSGAKLPVSVRLKPELVEFLRHVAKETGHSLSGVVGYYLETYYLHLFEKYADREANSSALRPTRTNSHAHHIRRTGEPPKGPAQ